MFVSDNKVQSILRYFINELSQIYDEREAKNMSEMVFQDVFSWDKIQLRQHRENQLSESELLYLKGMLKRLKKHEPLQYVLEKTEFYGLPFKTDKRALIPRPETEELVDVILKDNEKTSPRILDIGTGTGCISIALKKHLPSAEVVGIDVAEEVIDLACENAQLNQVSLVFLQQDIFLNDVLNLGEFDIIVSNPPYIEVDEKQGMCNNVLDFEPHQALFVKHDKLEFYERICSLSKTLLSDSGKLYFELNERNKNAYDTLFYTYFKHVQFIKDIHQKSRMAKLFK